MLRRRGVDIGRMPVMLRSCLCVLNGKTREELERLSECPYDLGGCFIVKSVERVLMMQDSTCGSRMWCLDGTDVGNCPKSVERKAARWVAEFSSKKKDAVCACAGCVQPCGGSGGIQRLLQLEDLGSRSL